MVLVIVVTILIISFCIEQYRVGQWRKDRLNEKPNSTNTYVDYFGMERDRKTNQPRFTGVGLSGDIIQTDKDNNIIKNLSISNENDKLQRLLPKAKELGIKTIELGVLPSEKNKYPQTIYANNKYKDINTKANYIVIKGSSKRGMDLAHYYYDFEKKKVLCPTDGFKMRFNDPKFCSVYNTRSIKSNLSWDDVLNEIPKLQEDINNDELRSFDICKKDDDYLYYFGKEMR